MNDDSWILDRFHLPMAAGVYSEYSDLLVSPPPIGSDLRITDADQIRITDGLGARVTD